MTGHRSDFIGAAVGRGFVHQCTDLEGLDAEAARGTITAYIGFDCTAPSLHAGSLVSIMLLRLLQRTGHKPIVLMGGGTTKVGDPSGKDDTRKLLSDADIRSNMAGIRDVFAKFLKFGDGPTDAIMVDNADWLDGLAYIPFLRDYGRHFSVNRMLGFDSVKLRLEREQPLSFLEFNYMVLQAYDFLELARRHRCRLQMGGSDQWGNIVGGVELGRRIDGLQLFGMTTTLLTTASGAKMGKTAEGAVWLNDKMLSAYDYWQYWRNTDDADVGRFLRLFTELPLAEIARLEALSGEDINDAKKVLADHATTLCHGDKAAEKARQTAEKVFEVTVPVAAKSSAPFSIVRIDPGLPTVDIPSSELVDGIPVFEVLYRVGLTKSRSEARKLIKGGGARLNDANVSNELQLVTTADVTAQGMIKVSAGKKRHALVRAV